MPEFIEAYSRNQVTVDFLLKEFGAELSEEGSIASPQDLTESDDFRYLSDALLSFNAFYAMGRLSNEIRHSNYIAYLLSPAENHGFGTRLLYRMFPLFAGTGPHDASDPADIVVMREYGIVNEETRTKLGRLDLLAFDRRRRRVGVVELKVDAKLGPTQLERYREWVDSYFCAGNDGACWDGNLIYLTPAQGEVTGRAPTPYRIDPGTSRTGTEAEYWTDRSFGEVAAMLETFLREEEAAGRTGTALDSLAQYVAYLGRHICPRQGSLAAPARALVRAHGPQLRRLEAARRELREQTIAALAPAFAAIGLDMKPKRDGRFASMKGVVVDLVPIETGFGWKSDALGELSFSFNLFGEIPCITVETRGQSVALCRKWRRIIGYKADNESAGKRVLTWEFALPSPIRPYPITPDGIDDLVSHVARRIARAHDVFLHRLKD